jgi:hypothetical protein
MLQLHREEVYTSGIRIASPKAETFNLRRECILVESMKLKPKNIRRGELRIRSPLISCFYAFETERGCVALGGLIWPAFLFVMEGEFTIS